MSSIGQSILMALTVTVNKYASSNVVPPLNQRRPGKTQPATPAATSNYSGRRGLLVSAMVVASQANDSKTDLLNKYLKKSKENKVKNDKERLESYYKRNYKDYFEFVEGGLKGKNDQQLSESEKGILDWLQRNK